MAFTPDGMFYLSQKDFQPSMDTLGRAVRGMFGLQNKEEAVNAILQSADYDTPEGRSAALDQIRGIDPDRWAGLNKQNIEFEKGELENLSKRAEPTLKAEWRLDVGKKWTSQWAENSLPGQPQGITNETDLVKYLVGLVRAGSIKNTEKNDWVKLYTALHKKKGEAYVSTNRQRRLGDKSGTISSKDVFGGYDSKAKTDKVDPATIKTDPNASLVDTYVNEPVGQGVKALGQSGKTVLDYITSGELQHDVLGKDISNAINEYINQPISNLLK